MATGTSGSGLPPQRWLGGVVVCVGVGIRRFPDRRINQTVSLRRRGGIFTDLARLGVRRNDLDRVLQYGGDAVDLAEQTESAGYVGRKLQSLQNQLTPFLTNPGLSDLSIRITQLTNPV